MLRFERTALSALRAHLSDGRVLRDVHHLYAAAQWHLLDRFAGWHDILHMSCSAVYIGHPDKHGAHQKHGRERPKRANHTIDMYHHIAMPLGVVFIPDPHAAIYRLVRHFHRSGTAVGIADHLVVENQYP